jgi:hypothetical protein
VATEAFFHDFPGPVAKKRTSSGGAAASNRLLPQTPWLNVARSLHLRIDRAHLSRGSLTVKGPGGVDHGIGHLALTFNRVTKGPKPSKAAMSHGASHGPKPLRETGPDDP